jgi:hypothetical protein
LDRLVRRRSERCIKPGPGGPEKPFHIEVARTATRARGDLGFAVALDLRGERRPVRVPHRHANRQLPLVTLDRADDVRDEQVLSGAFVERHRD